MSLPTRATIVSAADSAALLGALGDLRDFVRAQVGGGPTVELTIASGAVSAQTSGSPAEPTPRVTLDTEADAASDDLDSIDTAEFEDGQFLWLSLENAARVVILKHEQGGDGQLSLRDGRDLLLDSTSQWVLFYCDGSSGARTLREVDRFGFDAYQLRASVDTASRTLAQSETGNVSFNTGASGLITMTLPTAVMGMVFEFVATAAQAVEIVAPSGAQIRYGTSLSADGGEIQSSGALGEAVRLVAASSSLWVVTSHEGTWTVT